MGRRRDEFDRLVTRHRGHVVRRGCAFALGDVSRAEHRLRHARIAACGLLGVEHRFVALLFGEARAVGHQIVVHETAREARRRIADVELYAVGEVQPLEIVETGQNDFALLGVVAAKEVAVRLRALLVERVSAFGDERRRGVGGLLQVFVGVGQAAVFAPRTFVERGARLEGQRRPAGHAGYVLVAREHVDRVVEVGHHVVHDDAAILAGLFQQLFLLGTDHRVVPGHVAVTAHLHVVEIGAEEIGHAVVFGAGRLVGAVVGVLQVIVDLAQGSPGPAAFVGGHAGSRDHVAHALVHHVVGVEPRGAVGGVEQRVELIGPQAEVHFRLEIGLRGDLVFGNEGQVAARAGGAQQPGRQYFVQCFHLSFSLSVRS